MVALLLLAAALRVILKIAGDLASSEVRAWLPHLSRRIIHSAAMRLPVEQRDILEAWEAELQEYSDRPATMLLVALRIWQDRRLITREARMCLRSHTLAWDGDEANPGRNKMRHPVATLIALFTNRLARHPELRAWLDRYIRLRLPLCVITLLGLTSGTVVLAVPGQVQRAHVPYWLVICGMVGYVSMAVLLLGFQAVHRRVKTLRVL